MTARPVISHDTRALMAAMILSGMNPSELLVRDQVQLAFLMTEKLITSLGYQVMQPATSETLTQSQEPPPRPPTQAEILRRLASYSTPAPRGRKKS